MANDDKPGLSAALDQVDTSKPPNVDQVEQLPLIPAAALTDATVAEALTAVTRRGPGRPAGSPNKRTKAWTDYILSRYQSPLIVLAETYSRSLADIKAELKCDTLEAFKIQLQAAVALAPYIHQKQPTALDVSGAGIIPLVINLAPSGEAAADGSNAFVIDGEIIDVESAKKQALMTGEAAELDGDELDD